MKVMVIGAAGFVGRYLLSHLHRDCGWEVVATKLPQEVLQTEDARVCDLDIRAEEMVDALFTAEQPDCIIHLAAQSSVAISWRNPQLTVDVNIRGTLNVLEAARKLPQSPRILLIGSGEEYGYVLPKDCPLTEEMPLHPANLYAVTKACGEQLAAVYVRAYGLQVICIRAFNIIGAGQLTQYVVSDFCKQAVEIELGRRQPVIRTGNLTPARDFTDVRDIVRAYSALAISGERGAVYNVGSGNAIAIADVLEEIRRLARVEFEVETDPAKLRPTDLPFIAADITKLRRDTGWQPMYSLTQTLEDTLAYWRAELAIQLEREQ